MIFFSVSLYAAPAQVHGYGVRGCSAYLTVYQGREQGEDRDILEFLRYQDWVSGMVTGLSLATAMDVLQGVEIDSLMRRLQIHCEEHPDDDFFTATATLIKLLSGLQ